MLEPIKQIPILRDLNEEQLGLLEPLFEVFTCPADCQIFEQDERAIYLYFLIDGTASLHYKPYDGARIILAHLHAGDVFGWSSVIGGPTYASSLLSETEIKAMRIRGSDLRRLCREHPKLGEIILDRLAEAVSGRWEDSRQQVQSILNRNIKKSSKTRSQ